MRCRGQQGRGFSRLPQPIKRHEALKNDVESGGVKNARVLNAKGGDKSTPPYNVLIEYIVLSYLIISPVVSTHS